MGIHLSQKTHSDVGICRETEPDWDKELAEDCKLELIKYGQVEFLKVERDSEVCAFPLTGNLHLIV